MAKTDEKLEDIRCNNCKSLLAKASLQNGTVQIKCKCGTVNTVQKDKKENAKTFTSFDVTVQHL